MEQQLLSLGIVLPLLQRRETADVSSGWFTPSSTGVTFTSEGSVVPLAGVNVIELDVVSKVADAALPL